MTQSIPNPHDALFKAMCKDTRITQDLLKQALPPSLFEKIELNSLRLTDTSMVSKQLRHLHSDLIYEAKIEGQDGFICFLIEHQSSADELMAFRKLEYNVALMRQQIQEGKEKLPVTINICLYHGEQSPYPHSTDLFNCFNNPVLAREWLFKPFQLIDLTVLSDSEIEQQGKVALLEYLLKHARDTEHARNIKQLIKFLYRIGIEPYLETMLYYLYRGCVGQDKEEDFLYRLIQALPNQEAHIMTYYDQVVEKVKAKYGAELMQKGLQEGMQQGMQQGMEQGMQKATRVVAKNLLKNNVDPEVVQKSTGLSSKIIVQLKKEIQNS